MQIALISPSPWPANYGYPRCSTSERTPFIANMRINIQRRPHISMPHQILEILYIHACVHHIRTECMPENMRGNIQAFLCCLFFVPSWAPFWQGPNATVLYNIGAALSIKFNIPYCSLHHLTPWEPIQLTFQQAAHAPGWNIDGDFLAISYGRSPDPLNHHR